MKNKEIIEKISDELIEITKTINHKKDTNVSLSQEEILALFLGSYIQEEVNESNDNKHGA